MTKLVMVGAVTHTHTHTHTHGNLTNNKEAENKAALVCVYKKRWIK